MTSNIDKTFEEIIANWIPPVAEVKAEVKKTHKPIEVGDILVAQWGYDANNVEFFKVLRRTAKFIEIAELNVEQIPGDTGIYMGVRVVPGTTWKNYSLWANRDSYNFSERTDGAPITFRKKIKVTYDGRECIDLADYANAPRAFVWDGQAKVDYNHH